MISVVITGKYGRVCFEIDANPIDVVKAFKDDCSSFEANLESSPPFVSIFVYDPHTAFGDFCAHNRLFKKIVPGTIKW